MSKFTLSAPTTAATNTSFGFNTPKATTTGFGLASGTTGFGAATTTTTGITFSTPIGSTTTAPSSNFTFGGTPITSATTQATLGGTNAPAVAGINLFASTPVPSTATTGALTFGAPTTTTATGLSFGLSTATPSFSAATTAATLTLSTTTPTLSFGSTTNTTSIGAPTFGTATTTAPSLFGTGSSLFAPKQLTTATTTTTPTTNRGLGGLDVTVGNKGLSKGGSGPATVKENLLPNELMQTIDNFKEFVKAQKSISSDIAKGSSRPLTRCAEDTSSLMELVTTLAGSVQRDRSLADKLMQDTAKALQNAEIAQRTHDTPAGLQYENNAPLYFFMELAESFEQDLMLFRSQIETTEKHIQTMMTPKTLTPQELTSTMSKLHESFIAIAGKLQGVHQNVQQKKEQYLNFRKYVLKDSSNVFENVKSKDNRNINKISILPTPISSFEKSLLASQSLNLTQQSISAITQNPLVLLGNISTTSSFPINPIMKPPTASLNFNSPVNLTAPLSTTDTSSAFQLQKPPLGNKKVKH